MNANELIGGMALPHGVVLLSRKQVALGYYDQSGSLQLYTRELKGPTKGFLGLWTLLFESYRALYKTYPAQDEMRYALAGALAGTVIGLPLGAYIRAGTSLPLWQMSLLGTALLALMWLGLYYFYPPFRQALGRMARYHGAEHKTIWAFERGEVSREGIRRQPLLHPACGSNLAALWLLLYLPLSPLLLFLPWWLHPLTLLPVLPLFRWMNRNPEHPLSRRLLALAYRFQRYSLAEPGEAELQAAWLALRGLQMDDPSTIEVEGSGSTVT
ncbi:DUF1385 domain-containing protein [Meiothermus sp.]|uniref:DUF1385 domain-containing protein n=1 Tax=Meiothermus sp. TaxID=1955249 RepID=UPI0021DBAB46|nr:DUF1385 domain-containing protein [Meiothermus sp.]GIW32737.1 MAG: membrane protein [Meiothermus sp.]